jgi:exodeoxyribonuclease VII small subunit
VTHDTNSGNTSGEPRDSELTATTAPVTTATVTAATGSDAISYEAARDELVDIVRQLEAGGLPLETSLTLWERGEQLAMMCQSWLDGAKKRLAARRPDTEPPVVSGSGSEATSEND